MHALSPGSAAPLAPAPLRSSARPFLLAFTALTLLLLGDQAWRRFVFAEPGRFTLDQAVRVLLLSLPFIVAMTLPAAVLLAAVYGFSRPGSAIGPTRSLVRQLKPVLLTALGLAIANYALLDQVLPRTNTELRRFLIALSRRDREPMSTESIRGDREMTIAELSAVVEQADRQAAAASARGDREEMNAAMDRAAQYRLEIQKKRALPAACLVFVVVGAGVGTRLQGRRWWLPLGAAAALFGLYYVGLIRGEHLADARRLSPVLAMWGGNLVLTLVGCLLLWRQGVGPSVGNSSA